MIPGDIKERLERARKVCVFTGAGVSAESGIPTFRGTDGLWENHPVEDLVTPQGFRRDPALVWRWHLWLHDLSVSVEPNAAHSVIAEMDSYYPEFLTVTQNIDNLHERAGTDRMVKLHGDITQMICLGCGRVHPMPSVVDRDSIMADTLPKCPECGAACRPNVVWFGELLPVEPLLAGREFAADCDVLLIVGTSGVVSGGYGFAELGRAAGALVIEVNPERSALSHLAHIRIRRPAAESLPELFEGILDRGVAKRLR